MLPLASVSGICRSLRVGFSDNQVLMRGGGSNYG
jgi:hypothetical protein